MRQRKKRPSSQKRKPRKADPATGQLDDQELDGVAGGAPVVSNTGIRVEMNQTRARQAQNTSFGSIVKEGMSKGADATLTASQLAAPFIPGAAVVSASDDDAS